MKNSVTAEQVLDEHLELCGPGSEEDFLRSCREESVRRRPRPPREHKKGSLTHVQVHHVGSRR